MIYLGIFIVCFMVLLFLLPFVLCGLDRIFDTHFSCDLFKWHDGCGGEISYDGCSFHSVCSKCGKKVMQDSQGNWF